MLEKRIFLGLKIVLGLAFAVFMILFLYEASEYMRSESHYEKLRASVLESDGLVYTESGEVSGEGSDADDSEGMDEETDDGSDAEGGTEDGDSIYAGNASGSGEAAAGKQTSDFTEADIRQRRQALTAEAKKLSVDFAALKGTNPHCIGWISIPGINLSYPVVQGQDNEYYLDHNFDGRKSSAGCIFLEKVSTADLNDYNSFIYGHNMKNGSMFGSLKKYVRDASVFEKNPSFYVYTEEGMRVYDIYSYYITPPDSDTYVITANKEDYRVFQERVKSLSVRDCRTVVDTDRPTLTLSTCSGSGENKQRLVIHGILSESFSR